MPKFRASFVLLLAGLCLTSFTSAQNADSFKKTNTYEVLSAFGCWSESEYGADGLYPTIRLTAKSKIDLSMFSIKVSFIRDSDRAFGFSYESSGGLLKGLRGTLNAIGTLGYHNGYNKNTKVVARVTIITTGKYKGKSFFGTEDISLKNIPIENRMCPDLVAD